MTDQGISVSQGTAPDVVERLLQPEAGWSGDASAVAPEVAEAGALAIIDLRKEIGESWRALEEKGFPPEACGWPFQSIVGELPNAITCALNCISEQRDERDTTIASLREQVDDLQIALSGTNKDWNAAMLRAHAAESRVSVLEGALENARRDLRAICPRSDTGSKRKKEIEAAIKRIESALSHSLPVNAGSTSSDGGASNSTAPGETGADKRSSADAQASSGASVVAGVRPGPSETLSPSTARVADREAIARILGLNLRLETYRPENDPADVGVTIVGQSEAIDAILSLLSNGGGTRTEGSEG